MVKKIALIVGCILIATVAVIVCLALTKPDEFKAERSIVINAPPEGIFAVIGDFHRFREWSPWEKLDPNLKTSFSGADSGKGAIYSWSGNDEAGEGRMEILEYDPPKKVVMNLHFIKPMEGDNTVVYLLEPQGDATKMTWSMHGPNDFVSKVMQVFMNCEAMVGHSFEEGLAKLKAICEK